MVVVCSTLTMIPVIYLGHAAPRLEARIVFHKNGHFVVNELYRYRDVDFNAVLTPPGHKLKRQAEVLFFARMAFMSFG